MARRSLPAGGKVPEDYAFHGLGADGQPTTVRLSELFRDGGDAVVLDQMMFPRFSSDTRVTAKSGETQKLPEKDQPCPSCTVLLDELNAAARHFEADGGPA